MTLLVTISDEEGEWENISCYISCSRCSFFLFPRLHSSVVERKHVVQGSEHLQTMFVAVPVSSSKDFQEKYEKLTDVCEFLCSFFDGYAQNY